VPKSSKQATVTASGTENGKFAATVKKMLATKPTLHVDSKKKMAAGASTPTAARPKAKRQKT
jgi:hypothetical protein